MLKACPLHPGGVCPVLVYTVCPPLRPDMKLSNQPMAAMTRRMTLPTATSSGFGEAAYQEKNNCYYTSNDQKRIHGQHIPFLGGNL